MEEEHVESSESSSPKSSQKGVTTVVAIIIIILLVAGGVIIYGMNKSKNPSQQVSGTSANSSNNSMMHETPTQDTEASPTAMERMTMGAQEITVNGQNYSFTPDKITVKKGDKVTIDFKNTEGFHDFVLDAFNVKTDIIPGGKDAKVTFTADKTGSFPFYCSVGNHRAMGMEGTLVVTP